MPPAARVTDMHTCPSVEPGPVPHVGGPILPPGAPTVLVNALPAATVTSMATCVGPPDTIVKGSAGVFINFLPAARLGDPTTHAGVIVTGSPNVIIGEIGAPTLGFAGMHGMLAGLAVAGVAKPKPKVIKVIKVSGTVAGTRGFRKINEHKQHTTNQLKGSGSASEDLHGNAPAVLVRGCKKVHLKATTSPADSLVTWEVKPNHNKHSPPALTVKAKNKAVLETNETGSFSVIATAGTSKVVWNVVFVSVEVDTASTVRVGRSNYTPILDAAGNPTQGSVSSGVFQKGQDTFEATVTVRLVGGGDDGKLGINKVMLRVLQNGVTDTLSGHYAPPPPNSVVHERVRGGFPCVDSNGPPGGGAGGDAAEPTITVASSVSVTPVGGPKRKVWTGDSPAGGFPMARSNPANGGRLVSITGINGFKTAIASISLDAPREYMVHADIHWQAHFDGTINAAGIWVKHGAHTVVDRRYKLISARTGGQDACDAGYEIYEPRFNHDTYMDPAP